MVCSVICHGNDSHICWKVPVIAVFTKFDQFRRDVNIRLRLAGGAGGNPSARDVNDEVEKIFQEQYLSVIKDSSPRHVRLQSKIYHVSSLHVGDLLCVIEMHKVGESCKKLISETADALNSEVVTLMLLAVQRGNAEVSLEMAVRR